MPTLGLLLVSLIWGTTFVAVKAALEDVSPLLFLGLRFGVATICGLFFLIRPADRPRRGSGSAVLWGLPLGAVLAVAFAAQTIGLVTTTPARSGFFTGLNVLLIPVWGIWILKTRPGRLPLIGLLIALVGMWFLADPGTDAWVSGDAWTLLCAVLFGLHVVLLSRFGASHDVPTLLVSQLAATSVLGLAGSLFLEPTRIVWSPEVIGALALTGVLASFVTTWLQLRLQPRVGPGRTAVLFALEPVFAAIFSVWIHGETLSAGGWLGGGLIVAGMLVSEAGLLVRSKS